MAGNILCSDHLIGPYSSAGKPITGNYWAEGPTTLKVDGKWMVFFDKYREHKYGAIQSTDLKHWEDISNLILVPKGIRHGTILQVDKNIFEKLTKE
jgi:hypothetical protein